MVAISLQPPGSNTAPAPQQEANGRSMPTSLSTLPCFLWPPHPASAQLSSFLSQSQARVDSRNGPLAGTRLGPAVCSMECWQLEGCGQVSLGNARILPLGYPPTCLGLNMLQFSPRPLGVHFGNRLSDLSILFPGFPSCTHSSLLTSVLCEAPREVERRRL